jgi:hypothetical protein
MLRHLALLALLAVPLAHAEEDGPDSTPAEPPFTFDNTVCPAFLTGIWLANSQQDVAPGPDQALWHVTEALVLNEGGVLEQAFASGISGDEPEETKTFGVWTAGPGSAADRCAFAFTFEEGARMAGEVKVLTRARILVDGQAFARSP